MKYYLYKIREDKWETFQDYDALIRYCAWFVSKDNYHYMLYWSMRLNCSLFNEINLNGNDTVSYLEYFSPNAGFHYRVRNLMFFDEDNRIIDIKNFKDDIFSCYCEKRHQYGDREVLKYYFRQEPIKGTGKPRYRKEFRNIRIKQMLSEISNPETKEYVRQTKPDLGINDWGEYSHRYYTKSWKSEKTKKQYMKKQNKKGVYVSKNIPIPRGLLEKEVKNTTHKANLFPKEIKSYINTVDEMYVIPEATNNGDYNDLFCFDKNDLRIYIIFDQNKDIRFRINCTENNIGCLVKEDVLRFINNSKLIFKPFHRNGYDYNDIIIPYNVEIDQDTLDYLFFRMSKNITKAYWK